MAGVSFVPDLIKGDLDSLRADVREFYTALVSLALIWSTLPAQITKSVPIVKDPDQYATDLMKCMSALEEIESSTSDHVQVSVCFLTRHPNSYSEPSAYNHTTRRSIRSV